MRLAVAHARDYNIGGHLCLTELVVDGVPVPVLRPSVYLTHAQDPRRYYGWGIDEPIADTTIALDRWWNPSGREGVLGARGYLVSVGSVICAGLELNSDEITFGSGFHEGRIAYDAKLAGVLRSQGRREILATGIWGEIMERTLGKRLLGGQGGTFTTIQPNDAK